MSDNYDNVCSFCGKSVDTDTLYYCCPDCGKLLKIKGEVMLDIGMEQKDGEDSITKRQIKRED